MASRLVAALVCGVAALSASAQSYPSKPIRLVVGFAPGSSTDAVARILAEHLRVKLGQPVTVDNKPGANGMLAATEVAKSAPDGHTVLISNSSTITVNPLVYKKIAYDPERDFAPAVMVISVPFILTVNPEKDTAVKTVADLMKKAKATPGKMSYGSAGIGNLTQLSFEVLNQMAGVDIQHVPYKGSALAQQAVLAKEVDAAFDNPAAMGLIKGGKLGAIAVSSMQRWRDLPDVPTLDESGYAGFDISFWIGALVPKETPAATHKTLVDAIRSAQDEPATRKLIEAQGNLQMLTPLQFQARIKSETARWAEVIKTRQITLD